MKILILTSLILMSYQKKINILSMGKCEIIKQIDIGKSLTKENFFESLYFHNLDTIFIQEHKNIKMIDKDYSHSMALVTSKGFLIKKEDVGSVFPNLNH